MDRVRTLYLCDPEKNPVCRKRMCYKWPEMKYRNMCFCTNRREFAAETADGKALLVIAHLTSHGFAYEIVKE